MVCPVHAVLGNGSMLSNLISTLWVSTTINPTKCRMLETLVNGLPTHSAEPNPSQCCLA